jgi:hypothetical protein
MVAEVVTPLGYACDLCAHAIAAHGVGPAEAMHHECGCSAEQRYGVVRRAAILAKLASARERQTTPVCDSVAQAL